MFITNTKIKNKYQDGRLITTEPSSNKNKKEELKMEHNDMKGYVPPPLFPNKKEEQGDALEMVKAHLESEYGKERATKRLKEMSGLQVLELAGKLRKAEVVKDNDEDDDDMSTYEPPALFEGGR